MNHGEMRDYTQAYGARQERAVGSLFSAVYGWMFAGLLVSGLMAWYTAASGLGTTIVQGPGFFACFIAEVAMVWILSACINKLSVLVATLMFVGYALLNGLTLSVVFLAYDLGTLTRTFILTAGMFGGLALYGTFTRSDLSKIGAFCGMAVWGLLLVCVVNMFFPAQGFDWVIGLAGIVIFTGLTMWDAQKIKLLANNPAYLSQPGVFQRVAIIGALELYLDFINLFLMLLRFFGGRRN